MLFELPSSKPIEEIERGLQEAAARHKFGILCTHDLKQKLVEKGVEFGGEARVYEVCNPQQAKRVLEANGALSAVLPCRISVYRAGDGYRIATLLPTELIKPFNAPALAPVAREVEETLVAMIRETA
ncbi:MAG: DUF302 domain-containing protein [bacterium]|jgi:uncharacterized protein (DUF302 family)